jgi:hypothetical protein
MPAPLLCFVVIQAIVMYWTASPFSLLMFPMEYGFEDSRSFRMSVMCNYIVCVPLEVKS